jgi:hypothetical protein
VLEELRRDAKVAEIFALPAAGFGAIDSGGLHALSVHGENGTSFKQRLIHLGFCENLVHHSNDSHGE